MAHAERHTGVALSDSLLATAQCVRGVLAGESLSVCLAGQPVKIRPSAQALSFFVMRRLGLAKALRGLLVRRAPADPQLDALLLTALALLDAALVSPHDCPDMAPHDGAPNYSVHTLVDQTVSCAYGRLRKYRGFLNGTLRNFIRQRDALLAQLRHNEVARWNYPQWWIDHMRTAWPQHWQSILRAGNMPPPMALRANRLRITVAELVSLFSEHGIGATSLGEDAVVLDQPAPVHQLPGFEEGLWSVQDVSAQLAGRLLPVSDGMRVLDACAAPGGKAAHLLERANIDLLAIDQDSQRLQRVQDTIDRLHHAPRVRLVCGDASQPAAWWDGQLFDAVLADVPCTGSGVVRRHPDIRWLRRQTDLDRTAAVQRQILDALWPLVAPGGHLLYVTCSVFPAEGEQQVQDFMQRHNNIQRLSAPGQLLPLYPEGQTDRGDGFFYALFTRTPSAADGLRGPACRPQ